MLTFRLTDGSLKLQAAEDMFRKAVMTFEGVKCGSLFDCEPSISARFRHHVDNYRTDFPPLNLVALCVMWPVSRVTSPRWFHKINVATTRSFSLPILLLIALYERQASAESPIRRYLGTVRARLIASFPTQWSQRLALLEGERYPQYLVTTLR